MLGGQSGPLQEFAIASLIYGAGWLALLGPKLTPHMCDVYCGTVVLWCVTMLCIGLQCCELVQIMST